jgi:seryl-tRNA synthetase
MSSSQREDEVYLSDKLIRQWMDEYVSLDGERRRLTAQVSELQEKISELLPVIQTLDDKIRAAAAFSPKLAQWIEEQEDNSPDNVALRDAILKSLLMVTNSTVALQKSTLQSAVSQLGYPAQKLQTNPDYLHMALRRLRDRKLIVEEPADHFRLTDAGRVEAKKKVSRNRPVTDAQFGGMDR